MTEPLDVRLVTQISASELGAISDYQFANRINGRSAATRELIRKGLEATGTLEAAPSAPADTSAPTIPEPDAIGRPTLGEVVLPWLRAQGLRSYAVADVVAGVFGETANQPGRAQAVTAIFKAMGWTQTQKRDGRTVVQVFTAPDGAA